MVGGFVLALAVILIKLTSVDIAEEQNDAILLDADEDL